MAFDSRGHSLHRGYQTCVILNIQHLIIKTSQVFIVFSNLFFSPCYLDQLLHIPAFQHLPIHVCQYPPKMRFYNVVSLPRSEMASLKIEPNFCDILPMDNEGYGSRASMLIMLFCQQIGFIHYWRNCNM